MSSRAPNIESASGERVRVLLCNPGLDGHDRGVKVVARGLRDAGMEVVYLPLRSTIEDVVSVAVQEDVDVVGISNLSATLVATCRRIKEMLAALGADDVLIVCGGTVLADDRRELARLGIHGVFGPGSKRDDIVHYIRGHVPHDRRTRPAGE